MNKKVLIGVGVAATLMAAYFIFKPKKKEEGMPEGTTGGTLFKCQFPNLPCPNNPNKCFNPLQFGQGNQCA